MKPEMWNRLANIPPWATFIAKVVYPDAHRSSSTNTVYTKQILLRKSQER